ncbi:MULTISPECIES: PAS and ANTAR domain-containing protein [unclassified Arthrobacter]|uniref:PAS and ANTAR domain-containing protein n=1 Tax=unclassified Arthrobacter TaxID=235627 RepID=UPI001C853F40|nr:PAS and ANTAR domain-containing protein [Arthrobacter sp. MAHUQ-56]MBX7444992.1 PAS and ANTAR domain-containing protein [Arthrobacter sp. MAHUQ-56]
MWSKLDTYLYPLRPPTVCPSGTFELDVASGNMQWSEGLFGIHGLGKGEVVPTFELLMAHKHPSDRDRVRELWMDLLAGGGQGALLHRVIDAKGRERRVFSAIQVEADASGRVARAHGFMVDITQSLRIESQNAASEAIEGVYAHKAVIEQAKGIVMGLLGVEAEAAFDILADQSQHINVKLHVVADGLVKSAAEGKAREAVAGFRLSR